MRNSHWIHQDCIIVLMQDRRVSSRGLLASLCLTVTSTFRVLGGRSALLDSMAESGCVPVASKDSGLLSALTSDLSLMALPRFVTGKDPLLVSL